MYQFGVSIISINRKVNMDNKPANFISDQPPVETDKAQAEDSKSGKKKILFGSGSVALVCIMAVSTYGFLSMNASQQSNKVSKVVTTKKETASAIDSQIQSYMNSEQAVEDAIGSAESQAAIEDANATQSLEGSYADF